MCSRNVSLKIITICMFKMWTEVTTYLYIIKYIDWCLKLLVKTWHTVSLRFNIFVDLFQNTPIHDKARTWIQDVKQQGQITVTVDKVVALTRIPHIKNRPVNSVNTDCRVSILCTRHIVLWRCTIVSRQVILRSSNPSQSYFPDKNIILK